MDFIAIEAPASRVSAPGESLELLDAALGIAICKSLQIIPDELVEALAKGFRTLACSSDNVLVDGQSDVHVHSIRAHILCVNMSLCRLEPSMDSPLESPHIRKLLNRDPHFPLLFAQFRRFAAKRDKPYQMLIHELLERATRKRKVAGSQGLLITF